jgi:hypothetical protein
MSSDRSPPDESAETGSPLDRIEATRRAVIAGLAGAIGWSTGLGRSLAATFANYLPLPNPDQEFIDPTRPPRPHLRVIRPKDFLYLDVEYENIAPDGDPATALVRVKGNAPALLIVNHQPQAIAEQAYQQVSTSQAKSMPSSDGGPYNGAASMEPAPTPPVVADARMAKPSRVVFVMPPGVSSIPFTLPEFLKAFRTWTMNLDYQAAPDTRLFLSAATIAAAMKGHFDQIAASLAVGAGGANTPLLNKALQQAYAAAVAQAVADGKVPEGPMVDAIIRQQIQRYLPGSAPQVFQHQPDTNREAEARTPA